MWTLASGQLTNLEFILMKLYFINQLSSKFTTPFAGLMPYQFLNQSIFGTNARHLKREPLTLPLDQ